MDLVEPAATVISRPTIKQILGDFKTDLLANASVLLEAYKNNVVVNDLTTLSAFTEADFGGYSRMVISTWDGPYIDANGQAYMLTPLQIWQCNGNTPNNSVYGIMLVQASAGVQATATNAGNMGAYLGTFVITNGGTLYEVAPKVSLTGATGSGATAHAVITNGVITSIVLDNPGSGYTTYTVAIDRPYTLVAAFPFVSPQQMALSTDAIPFVAEVAIPPITTI